jgi:hypothetical protein
MNRPSFIHSRSAPSIFHRLARTGLMIGVAGGCLLGSTTRAMAALNDTVVFTYGTTISDPPATNSQLGTPPWATVTLTEQADGLFWMDIDTSFNSTQTPPSDPSLTQLAFNLNTNYSSYGTNAFSLVNPFCLPNSPTTTTTCDGKDLALAYALNGQGITGSGQPQGGFDLLVQLPPPGVKLDNSQAPIRLFIQAPTTTFSVADFLGDVSTDGYETAAKIQELKGTPGSTVITGTGELKPEEPPIDPETQVPGPLPILGGASAWAFSRRLRRRVQLGGGAIAAIGSA